MQVRSLFHKMQTGMIRQSQHNMAYNFHNKDLYQKKIHLYLHLKAAHQVKY